MLTISGHEIASVGADKKATIKDELDQQTKFSLCCASDLKSVEWTVKSDKKGSDQVNSE